MVVEQLGIAAGSAALPCCTAEGVNLSVGRQRIFHTKRLNGRGGRCSGLGHLLLVARGREGWVCSCYIGLEWKVDDRGGAHYCVDKSVSG